MAEMADARPAPSYNYAKVWTEALREHSFAQQVKYDVSVFFDLDAKAGEQIAQALQLVVRSRRQGRRLGQNVDQEEQRQFLPLPQEYYTEPHKLGKEHLQRLLHVIAKWNVPLGYNRSFALFCAQVMSVVENVRAAFFVCASVYSAFDLDQYYLDRPEVGETTTQSSSSNAPSLSSSSAINQDVEKIWLELDLRWPDVTKAFARFGRSDLFRELAVQRLRTLLANGYDPKGQSFKVFVQLLHRLIVPCAYDQDDPRRQLREIVICIFGRQCHRFRDSVSEQDLLEVVNNMQAAIHIDQALLDLIDAQIHPNSCRAVSVATVMPAGCTVGWLLGSHVPIALADAAPWALLLVATSPLLSELNQAIGSCGRPCLRSSEFGLRRMRRRKGAAAASPSPHLQHEAAV
eukprot:CAMPEP_0180438996 /NCGR_PEP_ID=MMETSP1036_2-20121128/12359_1 /TAXON_ID=632150 /ORGANISM="Azadinium spinosum, Strain 3D9" /LENGTH=402 /DNA_ID=CAMNT_0022445119 /DNA_START=99 /DNA_END=1303 /DNA_ORIENTATION=-